MKTRIKVSTEIERGLTSVKPGDVVISLEYDVILIVVKTNADGSTFDGLVLDSEEEINHWERYSYRSDFPANLFEPFIGTITLECE